MFEFEIKSMKQYTLSLLFVLAFTLVLASCNRGVGKKQVGKQQKEITIDIEKIVDDYNNYECSGCNNHDSVSFPDDIIVLAEYFKQECTFLASNVELFLDSIGDITGGIPHHDNSGLMLCENAVHELRRFQTGERKYYPDKEVKEALDAMAYELRYCDSHCGDGTWMIGLCYWFSFASQAALLCPNVEFISQVHSPDHQIGLLSYKAWNPEPLMTFLFIQREGYCTVQLVDFDVKLEKIFEISESGKDYYLMVSDYYTPWGAYLYEKTSDGLRFVAKEYGLYATPSPQDETDIDIDILSKDFDIVFNPKKYQWDFCIKSGDYWHKIEGTKSLYLRFDKKEPYFEIH